MSHCVYNTAQTFNIDILIMPQHFGCCVTNQGQFVLVCTLHILHQGGEGVASAMRGVFPSLYAVYLRDGVFYSTSFQGFIEFLAIFLNRHLASILCAEDGSGNFVFRQTVNDRLNFRGYGDNSVFASFSLGTSGQGFLNPVIIRNVQFQKFRRSEPKVTLLYFFITIILSVIDPKLGLGAIIEPATIGFNQNI